MYEPTTDELKAVWQGSGLWRDGHTFDDDIKVPVIRDTLRRAVIARHKSNPSLPEQANLPLVPA
jgi:hypothetical protein